MARILFCWELGGALGHLAIVRTLAERLRALGHEIHLAATETCRVRGHAIPMPLPTVFHAVPAWSEGTQVVRNVRTYGHILRNIGYGDSQRLALQHRAWKRILQTVGPDVLVCESSPTALLAARGMSIPIVLVGTGFSIPPQTYPLPDLRCWDPAETPSIDEDELLASINSTLGAEGAPPLARLHGLFEATETAICSVPELDAYRGRANADYFGEVARVPGLRMPWRANGKKRVFAYLKPFPELPQLLEALRAREVSAIIYGPQLPRGLIERHRSDRMQFVAEPVDVAYTLSTASLVVTHGHGLALQALQSGVPVLLFPLMLEQYVVAHHVAMLGVGQFCSPWGSDRIAGAVDAVLDDDAFTRRAQEFSCRYAHLDAHAQASRLAARISALAH